MAKLSDVEWVTVTLPPVTRCQPPEGHRCGLDGAGTRLYSPAEAKRHALDHPGHLVTREIVTRTVYRLVGE